MEVILLESQHFIPQEVSFRPFFGVVLLHNFYRAFAKSLSLVN